MQLDIHVEQLVESHESRPDLEHAAGLSWKGNKASIIAAKEEGWLGGRQTGGWVCLTISGLNPCEGVTTGEAGGMEKAGMWHARPDGVLDGATLRTEEAGKRQEREETGGASNNRQPAGG